jgi:hypothetical protein
MSALYPTFLDRSGIAAETRLGRDDAAMRLMRRLLIHGPTRR